MDAAPSDRVGHILTSIFEHVQRVEEEEKFIADIRAQSMRPFDWLICSSKLFPCSMSTLSVPRYGRQVCEPRTLKFTREIRPKIRGLQSLNDSWIIGQSATLPDDRPEKIPFEGSDAKLFTVDRTVNYYSSQDLRLFAAADEAFVVVKPQALVYGKCVYDTEMLIGSCDLTLDGTGLYILYFTIFAPPPGYITLVSVGANTLSKLRDIYISNDINDAVLRSTAQGFLLYKNYTIDFYDTSGILLRSSSFMQSSLPKQLYPTDRDLCFDIDSEGRFYTVVRHALQVHDNTGLIYTARIPHLLYDEDIAEEFQSNYVVTITRPDTIVVHHYNAIFYVFEMA